MAHTHPLPTKQERGRGLTCQSPSEGSLANSPAQTERGDEAADRTDDDVEQKTQASRGHWLCPGQMSPTLPGRGDLSVRSPPLGPAAARTS